MFPDVAQFTGVINVTREVPRGLVQVAQRYALELWLSTTIKDSRQLGDGSLSSDGGCTGKHDQLLVQSRPMPAAGHL